MPGAEAENKPLTLSDFNEIAGQTPAYLNFMCWKYDQVNSFWDIASQSQKSGARLFKQARLFGNIYMVCIIIQVLPHIPVQNTVISSLLSKVLMADHFVLFQENDTKAGSDISSQYHKQIQRKWKTQPTG